MKKNVFYYLLFFSITSCAFFNSNSIDQILSKYSDQRPYPNVISEREAVSGALKFLFKHKELVDNMMQYNPDCINATIGDVILVENINGGIKETSPYYYYITGVMPDKKLIVEATIFAMDNSKWTGKIYQFRDSYANPIYPSERTMSSNEAVEYFKKQLNIDNTQSIKVKAVYLQDESITIFNWGWAMKTDNPIAIKSLSGIKNDADVFFINHTVFTESGMNMIKSTEKYNYYLKLPRLSILSMNIFDEINISKFKTMSVVDKINNKLEMIPICTFEQ